MVEALGVVLEPAPELTCNDAMAEVTLLSPSSPLKLRLLYRLAGSIPPERITCVSSALFARLCPGLNGCGPSFCVGPIWEFPPDVERCVGVEAPVGMLLDESVRPAPRLYRPGEGLAGVSPIESERSGMEVDSVMEGAAES